MISTPQRRRGCFRHQLGLLWPWPSKSNQVISRDQWIMSVLSKLFRPFVRYRGNKIWLDGQTIGRTARQQNAFDDCVGRQRHKMINNGVIAETDLWFHGVLDKISRLPPHVFRYADSRYFCSPSPLWCPLPWCPGQLPQSPTARSATGGAIHESALLHILPIFTTMRRCLRFLQCAWKRRKMSQLVTSRYINRFW